METSEDDLVGGTRTYEQPAIGYLALDEFACTGTLVSPNVVLAAAHCVDYRTGRAHDSVFSVSADNGRTWTDLPITQFVSYGGDVGPDDVALFRLAEPVSPSFVTPLAIASTPAGAGTALSIYGFGCSAKTEDRPSTDFVKRRYDFVRGAQISRAACDGDSGGPVLDRGNSRVVGVVSGSEIPSQKDIYGNTAALYTKLQAQIAAWAVTVPAPPPPPPSSCGPWQPYTSWTCSGDGFTRGRCTATGVQFEHCPIRCDWSTTGAVCR